MASNNGVEGQDAGLVPVLAREAVGIAIILVDAANEVEGREGAPEDQIDQASALEHASETPHGRTAEDGVASDALNAGHFNVILRLIGSLVNDRAL